MKKISSILIVLVLTFAFTFALPQKEAEAVAWGLAVPGGITIGAGAYTLGALGLGVVVGIAGYDTYSEEINAHALRAWENGTQLSKDSMNLMINSAIGLGHSMTNTDAGFNTWMDSTVDSFGSEIYNIVNGIDSGIMAGVANTPSTIDNRPYFDSGSMLALGMSAETGQFLVANGIQVKRIEMYFTNYGKRITITNMDSTTKVINFPNMSAAELSALQSSMRNATTHVLALHLLGTLGVSAAYLLDQVAVDSYNQGVSKTREAWQDMKDAGLVLPVDSAIPVYQGNAVNYNAETDVYTGVDGGVIAKGDLTWHFPQPRIRTGEELDVTVPPGVYVDNPVGTYNPALPDTVVVPNVAVPTTTNITTGVTTGKTTTGEPPPTGGTTPTPKGEPVNPFNAKPIPIAALTGLFQLLAALIFYLIRMFTFIATIAFIAPTPIENPYFLWFTTATFQGITPYPLVQNLALFFLGFSVYKSVRRVFG